MAESVIFVCTGNSCRSQMAQGLLTFLGNGRFDAFSAGTDPQGLNPLAVSVMDELGIDICAYRSESIDWYAKRHFDFAITVSDRAKETCPVFPGGGKRLHWSFEDPAAATGTIEERLAVFRLVRDEIKQALQLFVTQPTRGNR
jgi:arsenate reductase